MGYEIIFFYSEIYFIKVYFDIKYLFVYGDKYLVSRNFDFWFLN